MTLPLWRLPPLETMPSYSDSAFERINDESICVSGIASAKALTAASISFEFAAQSLQQLWNSLRRRTTSRDSSGWSRLIFTRAAAYASFTSLDAKNGDCAFAADGAWQREQYS